MNHALLKEIVSHVMAHFRVIPSSLVDRQRTDSLLAPIYLLPEKIVFEEGGEQYLGKTWGCQITLSFLDVKVMLGECTTNPQFPEFALVVQPKDNPIYGLYLCFNEISPHPQDSEPDLCVSVNKGTDWMECSTYLQGTFLAATEQLRETTFPWVKCTDYQPLYRALLSFMSFHDARFGMTDEGQED